MITRALDAAAPASWVAGDEVYGASSDLRAELESRQIGYVLAVACDHRIDTANGTWRADEIAKRLPRTAWNQLSAGDGAKGNRWYRWALIDIASDLPGHRWLLVRRNPATGELAYYRCYSPHPVPLKTLVTVAGRRRTIEEIVPSRQGVVRSGRASGPNLDLMATLGRLVDAGLRLPRRPNRPRPISTTGSRDDPADLPPPACATTSSDKAVTDENHDLGESGLARCR